MLDVGEVIKNCRKFRGVSQADLAKRAGITAVQISRYERGENNPTFDTVQYILEALGFKLELTAIKEDDYGRNKSTDR